MSIEFDTAFGDKNMKANGGLKNNPWVVEHSQQFNCCAIFYVTVLKCFTSVLNFVYAILCMYGYTFIHMIFSKKESSQ